MAGIATAAMPMTQPHLADDYVARASLNTNTSTLPSPDDDLSSMPRASNENSSVRCTESSEPGNAPSSAGLDNTTTTSSLGDDCVVSGQATSVPSSGSDAQNEESPSKSGYRGVSFDRKKRKWRVQIKVANLGKSGVSVGYYDTEEEAAKAYDRAAIGLYNSPMKLNFPEQLYDGQEIATQHRRMLHINKPRTSKFFGVGATNRKNQWQARIIVDQKVTHLGYYSSQEEAAQVYDKVAIALHGPDAQTNYPSSCYTDEDIAGLRDKACAREDLQKMLGVKPMDKSSKYRGVSRKKNKWEAKVMVNRQWKYRELFPTEVEAACAYDMAVRALKGPEAEAYVNFKEGDPNASTGMSKIVRSSKKLRGIGVVFPNDAADGVVKRARHDGEFHHASSLPRTRSTGHMLDHEEGDVDITPLSIHPSHSFVGSGPSMRSCHTAADMSLGGSFSGSHASLMRHPSDGPGALSFHAPRDGPMSAVHNPFAAYESGSGHSDRVCDLRGVHDFADTEYATMGFGRPMGGREQLLPAHSEPLWVGPRGHPALYDRWAQEMEAREMWAARAFQGRAYSTMCMPGEMFRRDMAAYDRRSMAAYDRRSVVLVRWLCPTALPPHACAAMYVHTQPSGPAYAHEFTMPMRTMSCGQSETDKPIGSRGSAPEPVQRSPAGRPTGHWNEGKGIARCQSEVLPRPPSSNRVLTAFLDEMTQDLEDPIMNMLGDELPGEGMGVEATAAVATPVFAEACVEAGRNELPPLPVSTGLPAELATKASGINLPMTDLPNLP